MATLPRWRVPPAPRSVSDLADPAWDTVPAFPLLYLADGEGPPEQGTNVRLCQDEANLYVRFDCADRDAWGTYTLRDDPIYREEAVEVFLAPGDADPTDYLEFEVSPRGVLFDARIHNPTSQRADLEADPTWNCPGLIWRAGESRGSGGPAQATGSVGGRAGGAHTKEPSKAPRTPGSGGGQDWWAALAIPWAALSSSTRPALWRANFYRIERPRDGFAEFSCWSPTLTDPADFHKPARFGVLEL